MSSKDKKKGESRKTLRKLMKFIAGYKWLLVISLLLAAASVILQLYVPVLFGNAIDEIISEPLSVTSNTTVYVPAFFGVPDILA